MDFADPGERAAFFEIHRGLPREGPGDGDSTRRALALAAPLAVAARVLDVGCGPGAQTLDLATALPRASIIALDAHQPFLADLEGRAAARGLSHRIKTVSGDMASMDFELASFDLIWCEGAAYIMGLPAALNDWKRFLKPGGKLALSEAVWLRPDPPQPAVANFASYPAMANVSTVRAQFAACGYRLLGDFVLPESAWWAQYYGPMEARLAQLEGRFAGNPEAQSVWREARDEIACYRGFCDYFGYSFFVATI
jgi:ubiquinone/menaquinone biosynthesis C-methylase UbiE